MPKDVIITPASGLIDFKDTGGASDATIQLDDLGNLNITNAGGVLSIGNTAANVYIGDGTNSVDIIFEQNGKIRGLSNKTLTLGQSDSFINFASPLTFISPDGTKTIMARMLNTDVLSFQGGAGELLSLNDSMTGTIFSVNDISGIPSIEVLDTGVVKLAPYSGTVSIGTTDSSVSTLFVKSSQSTYALDVQKTTGHAVAIFYQANSSFNTDVYINNAGSATNWMLQRRNDGATWWYNDGANPIVMHVQATERLRINPDGVTTTIRSNNTNNIVESVGSNGYGAFYAKGSGTNPSYMFFASNSVETGRIAVTNTNAVTFQHGQSATERFRIAPEGPVIFGRTYQSNERVGLGGTTSAYTSATSASGVYDDTTISSGQTAGYTTFSQYPSTAAASFTVGSMMHFKAQFYTKGSGSTITNQFGFTATGLTQATNNYGFYADMNSQANTWNAYMQGTAQNYFGGNVGVGHNDPSSFYGMNTRLLVVNNQNAATILAVGNSTAGATASTQIKMVGGTANSHTTYSLSDNTGVPTANIDFGSGVTNFTMTYGGSTKFTLAPSGQVTLGAPNGTAPLVTSSTTKVTNLNADLIDGLDSTVLVYGSSVSGSQGGPGGTWSGTHISQYKSGFWDQSGASWTPDTGWWWGITAAHTSNTSSYMYGAQLVFQNSTNPAVYIRTLTGGATPAANPWYQVWHAGTDGAGSGLDADLLDGYHVGTSGSTVPLLNGNNTFSGQVGFSSSATSSYNLLASTAIAAKANAVSGFEVQAQGSAATAGAAVMTFHRPSSYAAFFGIDTDNNWKVGGWSMGAVSYKIWHEGNDGTGTGLDADLLDGSHRDTAYNNFGNGTIPVRHSSGYLYSNFFNCTADTQTVAPSHVAIQTSSDNFIRWQTWAQFKTNLGMAGIESTGLGLTGTVSLDTTTNTAAEWAALPVGYARMFGTAALRGGVGTEGAPDTNYGYFFKMANRDAGSPGWAGLWASYTTNDFYVGRSSDGSTTATWTKMASIEDTLALSIALG